MSPINPRLAELLEKRGILSADQEAFLHPDFYRDVHDPYLMKDMEEAVVSIVAAMEAKKKIAVFGDYDADGVPATALLVRTFQALGVSVIPYIPTRASGYGLTMDVVAMLLADGIEFLITVDNGTVSKQEVAALAAAGTPTVICDHHEPQEEHLATDAVAILNPKQPGCPYPFKELCGCGLAWKLMNALYLRLGKNTEPLKWELDLVALSTVADMVPLLGENRALVKFGLKVMAKTRNLGLKALAASAALDLEKASAGAIGFRLAPRINAPSRMHQETVKGENAALTLLTTGDPATAVSLAGYLNAQNLERQALLDRQLKEAEQAAAAMSEELCLVVYGAEWSSGVIGLLAGRLVERYKRPAIALAREGGVIKGSARSIDGIHTVEVLQAGGAYLERYGGHAKAGGLTFLSVEESAIPDAVHGFRTAVQALVATRGLTLDDMRRRTESAADLSISLDEATLPLADQLAELEPYGIGFPAPVLHTRCFVLSPERIGKERQHLRCRLRDENGAEAKGIGFGLGDQEVVSGALYDVYYRLAAEEWQGRRSASCQIQRIVLR